MSQDADSRRGCTIDLFGAAVQSLTKIHGPRLLGASTNRFLDALGKVERIWESMPEPPAKPREKGT